MEAGQTILIRIASVRELVLAETLGENRARLIEIPARNWWLSIFDVVEFDPASAVEEARGVSYQFVDVHETSHYSSGYDAWALLHRPQQYDAWVVEMEESGIVVQEVQPLVRNVRHLLLATPPGLSALAVLVRLNRAARTVEVIAPVLAAAADDVDRAKSDLERAVAWGASDAALTRQLGEAFNKNARLDVAVQFWERLTHLLPDDVEPYARLAHTYELLGLPSLAAQAYDRATNLAEHPMTRQTLAIARDRMWEKSKR